MTEINLHITAFFGLLIFVVSSNSILLANNNSTGEKKRNETVKFGELPHHDYSIKDNQILTDSQRIDLKELRKLARMAGHEQPEIISVYDSNICYKKDCLESAKDFFMSMDLSQEPCSDWGKFACEWRTLFSKTAVDEHTALVSLTQKQLNDILTDSNIDKTSIAVAQSYFTSCLAWFEDFNKIDHITSYLEELGRWPLLEGIADSQTDWLKLMVHIMRIVPENVTPYLFKIEAVQVKDNDNLILKIDSGSTSLNIDPEDVKIILQTLRRKASTTPQFDTENIRLMQRTMQRLSATQFDGTDAPKILALKDLETKIQTEIPESKFSVIKLLQGIFAGTDLTISSEIKIVTNEESFIKYIQNLQSSDSGALSNILFLQIASLLIGDTTNLINERNLLRMENYKRFISKYPTKHCLKETSEIFSHTLSEEFLIRHYNPKSQDMINTMIDNLKTGFVATLNSIKWVGNVTNEFLRAKITQMEFLNGYPNWLMDEGKIDIFYKNMNFVSTKVNGSRTYLPYRSRALSWLNGKYWKLKLDNELVNGWNYRLEYGFVGDAHVKYIPSLNQLLIPAGILQQPIFSVDYPGYVNFGGLGSQIGRVLAQAFDLNGIYTNGEGEIGMWFDEKSYRNYIDWTTRLQQDWERNELNLNDKIISVLAYHITMNGYKQYLKQLHENGQTEQNLPGLSIFTPEKILQLKYTNVLCESQVFKYLKMDSDNDSQESTISTFLFPVSRSQKFAEVFGCETDSIYPSLDFQ